MAWLDELNTSTKIHIVPGVVDNVFKNDPLLAHLRANTLQRFPGGTKIQENFTYGMLDGGPYAMGDSFDITARQTDTGGTFDPKLYKVNVTLFKEQIQIFNKGPEAVFRLVDSKMQNAALTMSAILAVDLYNEGISASRLLRMNGLAEALNDGSATSWTGSAYTTYGGVTRSGTIGTALNSPMTGPTANVNGPITYKILEEGYNSVVIGSAHPDLMVTTNLGMSYIKEKFQPQWRVETQDPKTGFNSIVFNAARLIQSQYCPGTKGSASDGPLSSYYLAGGETLWYLNTDYIRMWVTDDPEFGFGFSGFKPAQDNTMIAGQYFFAGNITVQAPRLQRHLFGING
jgi:hypothetical protein